MKNRIFNKCAKIAQSFQQSLSPLFDLDFLFKILNVFNFSAATKNLITNYTFVKQTCVLLIGETRTQWQIFEVDIAIL